MPSYITDDLIYSHLRDYKFLHTKWFLLTCGGIQHYKFKLGRLIYSSMFCITAIQWMSSSFNVNNDLKNR